MHYNFMFLDIYTLYKVVAITSDDPLYQHLTRSAEAQVFTWIDVGDTI